MHPADTVPETGETADVGVLKRALASATARIWLLVLAVAAWSALVGGLWLPAASVHARGFVVPWWLLAVGFAASEMFPVHLDIRRNTWSLTLTEIPLIIGLVLSPSIDVVVGQVAGCIVAWGLIRRQALHKLSFNTSIAALEAAVAVIVYHVIAGNESAVHPIVWAAAFAAMIVEGVVSSLGVAVAITALTGSFPDGVLENFLISGVLASSCGTALALGAAMVLRTQPYAAILLVVIAAILAFGYHELASTRRRYSGLQLLYGFTEAMQHSTRSRA